ncbi:8-amino-7-oxononanoate synthase [Actinopolyspora mortivallis]|uniref:8-amino-7-oxononanoate synthase n=1 Tax=Actinopolyspora mortivallis TaxID=33906 RepID=UPI0003820158|nr:8-amino-7-oxononanoate synthase [Actinopolyspora mortivallis]
MTPEKPPAPSTAHPETVFAWVEHRDRLRRENGLHRVLRPRAATEGVLDLAGNDYLGLSRHPVITEAAAEAVRTWGAGSTGSRLVTGTTELHATLEEELAAWYGTEAALVFSSGYAANLALVTALTDEGSLIVSDRNNHASLIDGCRLCRAEVRVVAHSDPDAVRAVLRESPRPAVVLTESVFSVDGDVAALDRLLTVCREHGSGLLVDDAHGLGVLGEGAGAFSAFGLGAPADAVATVTLSKALGAQGGAVLGPRRVVEHIAQTARPFVFDTALAPAAAAAALAGIRLLRGRSHLPTRVRAVTRQLREELLDHGIGVGEPGAAVLGVPVGAPEAAVAWASRCLERGVRVGCFRPPSVPDADSRLRLTARADLEDDEVRRVARVIAETAPEFAAPAGG